MKKQLFLLLAVLLCYATASAQKEGLKQYTLSNGLTVYLWEDSNQPDVSGQVVFRVGSIDEPAEFTGLAHYFEHMIFKGTQTIGALDWEKESPLYNQIVTLYDELAATTDEAKRAELTKKINEISMEAAKYSATDDFSNLTQGMGGEGLNAFTSYDITAYFNNFPAYEMEKWLTLNSDRWINPVFRGFQAELENVFEEYNMYEDVISTHTRKAVMSNLYKGSAYERDIIGLPEHLKNPQLSKLIKFFNDWYTPDNMALIIVGNFNSATVEPLIEKTFGRLQGKMGATHKTQSETDFSGNPKVAVKLGYYPQILWGYKGVKSGHPDELALNICVSLLSNRTNTGLLDKLMLDGDVQYAGASLQSFRDQGRILIQAVPYYDISQRTYGSDRATERLIFNEIDKIKNGNIEDWLIKAVKDEYARTYDLLFESSDYKASILRNSFAYQIPMSEFFGQKEKLMSLTKADIQRVAKHYFSTGHLTVSFSEGTPRKNKLKKPDIKPLDPPKGVATAYAKEFKKIPMGEVKESYNNFADVSKKTLYPNVELFRTENKVNDIFTLTLRYGVGSHKMPKLPYAVQLLNTAGIMPNTDAQSYRRELSELGASCSYRVSDDYFYISIEGKEQNLEEICRLVTRQLLFPNLDDKQLNSVKGAVYNSRVTEGKRNEIQEDALWNYVLYQEKSSYIDRLKFSDLLEASISNLTGEVIRATEYALDIHYVGKRTLADVEPILAGNLPLKESMKPSESPNVIDKVVYTKPSIYFLPNSDAQQAKIYFYIDGKPYSIAEDVEYNAFNEYFSGGFSGLVMSEIREKRSMAYTAYGVMSRPAVTQKKSFFRGFVGTQPDKVADAIDVYMELITNMPAYPERIEDIKTAMRQSMLTNKPSFRSKSQTFDRWQKLGYKEDPAKVNMERVNALTFEHIVDFHATNIKGKPVTIVIMGDPKLIDMKSITQKHGKVTRLNKSKLFSTLQ